MPESAREDTRKSDPIPKTRPADGHVERPRIAVFGIFGRSNLGNEATLAAFLDAVRGRFPDAEIKCIGPDISDVTSVHGLPLVAMDPFPVARRLWRVRRLPMGRALTSGAQFAAEPWRARLARRSIREFDALIVPGTGVLDDFSQGPMDLPYHLLRWCSAASKAGIPILFLSVGAEPVTGRWTRRILQTATSKATFRTYRDEESRKNAHALGVVTAGDDVYPDLAFGLSRDRLPIGRQAVTPPRTVGIGVMGYYGWNAPRAEGERIYQRYLAKLRSFVTWILDNGYAVRFLVGDTDADARPVHDLTAQLATHRPLVNAEPIRDYEDLLRQIIETDLVIATRLHNVLLSLVLERPVISLSYSPKNDAAMAAVGLSDYSRRVQDFDPAWLKESFGRLSVEGGAWIKRMREINKTFRDRLNDQYRDLFNALVPNSSVAPPTGSAGRPLQSGTPLATPRH